MLKRYVLGFLFDPTGSQVALVHKERPAWQAGRLNAVGGKIEPGEEPKEAMIREFREETGVTIKDWKNFGQSYGDGWNMELFVSASPEIYLVTSETDEQIEVIGCRWEGLYDRARAVSPLPWLISAARDCYFNSNDFRLYVRY